MKLGKRLPEDHLGAISRDTVKLGVGLIATMTALVLGLVTASAKNSFDSVDTAVKNTAMDLLTLDRLLARYGPETDAIRATLKESVERRVNIIWSSSATGRGSFNPLSGSSQVEKLVDGIRDLHPQDDRQRLLRTRAVDRAELLLQVRWLVVADTGTSVPLPFLIVILFWLTIIFATFGLLAPQNTTILGFFFVCALCVGSAVFLILEMDGPFNGVLKVSPEPLRHAFTLLAQ